MSNPVKILDLTPVSRYMDGSPVYSFHTSFPSRGVRKLGAKHPTPDGAFEQGQGYVADFRRSSYPGGMGEVLGVVKSEDGQYHAVINTYYSFS